MPYTLTKKSRGFSRMRYTKQKKREHKALPGEHAYSLIGTKKGDAHKDTP